MTTADKIKAKLAATGDIPPVSNFEMMDTHFSKMCNRKMVLDAIKKWAEAELKKVGPEIETVLMAEDCTAAKFPDGIVVKVGKGRTGDKVVVSRLVELGVPVDTIAAATEEGKPYTFAQIVVPKGEGVAITTFEELEALAENYGYEAA